MPNVPMPLRPGVNTQGTSLQNENAIAQAGLIRIRQGQVEKLGGCSRLTTRLFTGIARALFAWETLQGDAYLAVGGTQRLEILSNGDYSDATPISATHNLSTAFSTIQGSSIVTIHDAGASPAAGGRIIIQNAIYLAGILMQGSYGVITGGNNYTIDTGQIANATVNGNGGQALTFTPTTGSSTVALTLGVHVFAQYENINVAVPTTAGGLTLSGNYPVNVSGGTPTIMANGLATSNSPGTENAGLARISYIGTLPSEQTGGAVGAFGSGPFGAGAFGVGDTTGGTGGGGVPLPQILEWSLDRWGQNLVACYKGSTIYQWVPPVGPGNPAAPVSGAPSVVTGLMTAAPNQQVIAWGIFSATLGDIDPLLVGWNDIGDLNDWTASVTNQAGTFRISSPGSAIVAGMWVGTQGLLFTDVDLWAMNYLGFPLVYGFNQIARGCGAISARCVGIRGNVLAWMSQNDFYTYQGGVAQPIPCTVRDFVFNNLDRAFAAAVHCAPNGWGNEMRWWFPTKGSNGQCTSYVDWNILDNTWDPYYGGVSSPSSPALNISAWIDQSCYGPPIGADYAGLLQQFETATDFDGEPLKSWVLSGWFEIADGAQFPFIERIFPDFLISPGGSITITIFVADDMAAPQRQYGPYTVNAGANNQYDMSALLLADAGTEYIIVRARGRVARILVECTASNTFWRYGKPLAVIAPDGRR